MNDFVMAHGAVSRHAKDHTSTFPKGQMGLIHLGSVLLTMRCCLTPKSGQTPRKALINCCKAMESLDHGLDDGGRGLLVML